MIKISKKQKKAVCDECHKPKNKYRDIHSFIVVNHHFNLCTECMTMLYKSIDNEFAGEFNTRNATEEDNRIKSKLRVLFNKQINGEWNSDCEEELKSMDFDSMSPGDKVLYKQIVNW